MPLPIAGDVRRALLVMNARAVTVGTPSPNGTVDIGDVDTDDERMGGPGANAMRLLWGDLVDVEEFALEVGAEWAEGAGAALRRREFDLFSAFMSLMVQSVALGALMERQRWEAQQDRQKAAKQ